MGSLTSCVKKAGAALSAEDKNAILEAARVNRKAGMSTAEAAKAAVRARLEAVQSELAAEQSQVSTVDTKDQPKTLKERAEAMMGPNERHEAAKKAVAERRAAEAAAEPTPLYASRPLTKASADDIRAWAASQGFNTTLPADDLHVTVAYSREPMNGAAMQPAAENLTVTGGKRTVEPLGDEGAVVLKFTSPDMQARWKAYRDAGASWDYDNYTPHVTITYDGKGVDLSKVEPYAGPIELGPERQEPLNADKADDYKQAGEVATEPAAPAQPAAATERFAAGQALTKAERKQVLDSLVDVYKAKGAPREQKGIGRDGNERYGYVYSPELFEKSDITGTMVRYYVTLPDGRRAHPSELFPEYTQSDIDAEMAAREARKRDRASDVQRATVPAQQFSTIREAVEWWDKRSRESTRTATGLPTIFPSDERRPLTNGTKFILVPNTTSGELLEAFADAGWRVQRAEQPAAASEATPPAPSAAEPSTADSMRKKPEGEPPVLSRVSRKLEQERDLLIQHNLTVENLLHAARMGGIPVPSLAVVKADSPMVNFGEITLIGPPEIADPKGYAGTKVFGADIYSPRYPNVTLNFTPMQKRRLEADLSEAMKATDERYIDYSELAKGPRELSQTVPFLWKFAKDNGIEPEVVRTSPQPLQPGLEAYQNDTRQAYELVEDPEFVKAALEAHRAMLVKAYKGDTKAADEEMAEFSGPNASRNTKWIVSGAASEVARYRREVRESGKVERYATRNAIENQLRARDLMPALEQAARDMMERISPNERIFRGFSYSGNRLYTPHTLENVVKILKKELRGGENFNYGMGSLRAKFTPQFKSVKAIREAKDRLVTKEQFEAIKKEMDADMMALSDSFGHKSLETTLSMVEDAAKMGVDRAAKEYDRDAEVTPEQRQAVYEFISKLRNLPTEYFEAKVLRDVDVAEFKAAVVPAGMPERARAYLESRGVKIVTYEKGNDADRAAKIKQAADENKALFSRTGNFSTGGFVSPRLLRTAVAEAITNWNQDLADVEVVNRVEDLPDAIQTAVRNVGAENQVRGLAMPDGRVYLVAENIGSVEEGRFVLFHEVYGHVGMRAFLGDSYSLHMRMLKQANPALAKEADAWFKLYGEDEIAARIAAGFPPLKARQMVNALAVEEALADRAGNLPELKGWQRIVAALQRGLRRMGLGSVADMLEGMTEAETLDLLVQARKTVQAGQRMRAGEMAGAMSRRFSSLRGMRPTASYVDATPRQQATLDAIDEGPDSTKYDLIPAKEDIGRAADAAFTDWEQERGIKYVPISMLGPLTGYNNAQDTARIRRLADSIKESNTFEPIFVGIDPNGEAYIMEGQHRARALELLGDTHVPAQVIVDMTGTEADYDAQPDAPRVMPTDYKAAQGQGALFSRRTDQTQTPEFKRWFGDSKVVDAEGKPLVVYHGTNSEFNAFSGGRGGFYFTDDAKAAREYSEWADGESDPRVIDAYLSLQNPMILGRAWYDENVNADGEPAWEVVDNTIYEAEKAGHDGLILRGFPDFDGVVDGKRQVREYDQYIAFRPEQIKSAIGNTGDFDPTNADIRFSRRPTAATAGEPAVPDWVAQGADALKSAASKIDTYAPRKTMAEKAREMSAGWQDKLVQGMFDSYAPLKKLDMDAYIAARMTKAADGAFEGMLMYGKPKMTDDGGITGELDGKGFLGAMQELEGEHDRFFMWLAGNRAKRLKAQTTGWYVTYTANTKNPDGTPKNTEVNRFFAQDEEAKKNELLAKHPTAKVERRSLENLFEDAEIEAMTALNTGKMADGKPRMAAFKKAHDAFNDYSKSVLDVAEKSGLIDGESRSLWEHDFYVPFYRVGTQDNEISGPGRIKGLVRQKAFERLKGGKENLGDLMENTLRNWSHLLSASLSNVAASKSLQAAERAGIAIEAKEAKAKEIAKAAGLKGNAVYFMDQGMQRWFVVEDPAVLTAVSALEAPALSGLPLQLMGKFKKYLTLGVTVAPAFKVRNLIRDTLAAPAVAGVSYNVAKNLAQGWKGTNTTTDNYAQMLFGGGLMKFGTYLEGDRAEHVKRLIADGVSKDTILDTPAKAKAAAGKLWDAWQAFGDRMENINRTALYQQLLDKGLSPRDAAFQARDLMDFSLQGAWAGMRMLNAIVPFLNARAQGIYKLGRAAKEDPKRMGYVVGAVALASIALMLAYEDDEDWKAREDWDRDGFWWFKAGDTAFRIPKPFEIGALGTIAERSVELMVSDEMTGARFADRMKQMLMDTFSMNPVPQMFKPMLDLYANKDSFTGRQIETLGMERLSKPERAGPNTSALARALGAAGDYTGLSPVQVDHLVRAYLGWLGVQAATVVDVMTSPLDDRIKPATTLADWSGGFVKDLPAAPSRYLEDFYKQAKRTSEAMADLKRAREVGDMERAAEIQSDKAEELANYRLYQRAQRQIGDINKQIRRIRDSSTMDAETKRERLDALAADRNRLAKLVSDRARQRQAEPV